MADIDSKPPLETAGEFIKSALASRTVTDSVSGEQAPVAVRKVEVKTGLSGNNQSLHFLVEGDSSFELNQLAVANAAKDVLSQVPTLAQNFNFSDTPDAAKPAPVVHNWRGDKNIDFKFDLPQGVEPAAVVKEILTMAQGASMTTPVVGKHTADVVADRQAAANEPDINARGAA